MKVLHILDHSLPIQSGYAFRSASILESMRTLGIEVLAITSPKHDSGVETCVNGIRYERAWRGPLGEGIGGQLRSIMDTRRAVRRLIRSFRPDVIHAHSPCLNGLAALGLRIPVVYEIRSSWEDAAVSSGKTAEGSARYRASRWLETQTARAADRIVVLCDGLLEEFRGRGIPREKMMVIGNAIDPQALPKPIPEHVEAIRRRLNVQNRTVLGFFGSFFRWEGLQTLIQALPLLIQRLPNVAVVLAGGGEDEPQLRKMAEDLGVDDRVIFAGRVPHADMPAYYALADLMVFPRRGIRIAEMVTPLKPLEAMHSGAVVIASNVGGHRELIRDGQTGLLFEPDDAKALADMVVRAIEDPAMCQRIRDHARTFVCEERTWDRMVQRYVDVYQQAIGS